MTYAAMAYVQCSLESKARCDDPRGNTQNSSFSTRRPRSWLGIGLARHAKEPDTTNSRPCGLSPFPTGLGAFRRSIAACMASALHRGEGPRRGLPGCRMSPRGALVAQESNPGGRVASLAGITAALGPRWLPARRCCARQRGGAGDHAAIGLSRLSTGLVAQAYRSAETL